MRLFPLSLVVLTVATASILGLVSTTAEAQTCTVAAPYYAQPALPQTGYAAATGYAVPATYAAPAGYSGSAAGAYGATGVYPVMRQPIAGTRFAPTPYQAGRMGFAGYQSASPYQASPYQASPYQASPYQAYRPVSYQPSVAAAIQPQPAFYGPGLLGQPKAYVTGQPIRNFFRYLTP